MREAVKRMLQETRNSSDDAGAGNEVSTKDQMDVDVVDKKRRTNHTALERQRRSEQRGLFDKLQIVLRSHPGSSRHHLLTMALREIQNLVKTSKCLEEKKKELTDMQSTYLKELALLSGKSEILIKHKLTDICKKQKMREQAVKWRPVFSHLLQSRAALLQANTAQPTVKPPPLLQPNFYIAKPAAQNSVHQEKSQLQPNPQRNHSSVHTPVCPPTQKSEPEGHQEAPEAPAQGTQSQVLSVPSVPHITAAQDGPLQLNSTPIFQNLSVQPPKPMTLPLIRSKTGRLILPSSLKPLGQGFYTLTYMETKQIKEGEVSTSANTQPSGVDSKSQDKSISAPQHPSGSENRCLLEEDKTKPSNSDPECSATTAPLSALNFVKSLYQHSAAAEKKQEGGTAASLNKAPSAVCLNFNLKKASNSAIAQPNRNPPTMGRRRGRPRKNRLPPEGENRNHPVAEETRKSEPTETQADDTPVIDSVPADKPAPDHPVPVKRRRGRPPKNRAHPGQPAAQGGSGSSKSNEDKPFIPVCGFKIPDIGPNADPAATTSPGEIKTSRPLTRGALGKDFPSAKKRSWIDIEKELDPELECDTNVIFTNGCEVDNK
ncbi:hypothetical protein INR49_027197 [Caranx melampygus]|nr:hypothetical protein INR49_027197 [Caranx melampygus]